MKKPNTVKQLEKSLERKGSHFNFQFTDSEYDYFMMNARLTEIEKKVLNLRRAEKTIVAIAFELNTCESNVNKIIKRIKRKIVMCIMFGD
jgi:DNA-binding NarL/FixJ family response regulator